MHGSFILCIVWIADTEVLMVGRLYRMEKEGNMFSPHLMPFPEVKHLSTIDFCSKSIS
jgi:hypothetical protein